MWVGFCAATGKLVQRHRVLAWSFSNSNFSISQSLVTTNLPNFIPNFSDNGKLRRGLLIGFLVGAIFLLVSTVAAFMFIRKKRRYNGNEEEVMEEWEVEFWPHHIAYHEIHSATNGFSENDIIGRGGNGRVYRGVISGEAVAVKVLSGSTNEELKQFLSEVSTLGRLRHRNLVTLRGWCRNRAAAMNMILVYEFMENSSLDKWIFDTCRILDWVARVRILRDVAAAVEYLHSGWGEARVLHRDIKASNVLLDSSMVGKLGDFGLARAQPYGKALGTTRVVGSAGYIAPELVRTGKASSETDVYAFGVLVLESVTGRLAAKEGMPSLVSWVRGMADMTAAVDQKVRETKGYDEVEAERVVLLGLACTREEARARPAMKEVVRALERTAAESGSGESAEDESAEAWLLESRLKEKWWSNKEFVGRAHLTVEELRTSMSSSTGPSLSESDVIVEGR